jgi:hypothetical protein
MTHRKHVSLGCVIDFPGTSIRAEQQQLPLLLALFEKGPPQIGNLGLEVRLGELVDAAPDDPVPGKAESLPAPLLASRYVPSLSATKIGAEG